MSLNPLRSFAASEASDQPAHARQLAGTLQYRSKWLLLPTGMSCVPPGSPFKVQFLPAQSPPPPRFALSDFTAAGDAAILSASRMKARDDFDANRGLDANGEDAEKAVTYANEVAKVLRENVVQGRAGDHGRYQLRIHEHTERGDNETIKQNKGKNTLSGVKCCSA
ncbi:mitochondrial zinc maintenance protein [Diplodia corticola]|uniref:Mitochondrial zinc maintenance protein 1, mitochondrial n=1 Tax=Diplodia corticola TaxID=236234 RepID=A0A1J9S4B8_9PEZI|nr:mitochondrial zinc maintenance protein [Diplodia corticola]OJD39795.1 mitochondrial zinc maintenance protein [Diplodia corticola]